MMKFERFLGDVAKTIYGAVVRPWGKYEVMAVGGLPHLASTLLQLKKKGCKICFLDDQFHFDKFWFSLRARIPYFLWSCFSSDRKAERESPLLSAEKEMLGALDHPACSRLFQYHEHDFKDFIREKIFSAMSDYFGHLSKEEVFFKHVLREFDFSGVLLHEDFSECSFLAEFVKKAGVQNFCISHANLALDCIIPVIGRCFAQSYTFVHAPHEKGAYVERGWDPEKVEVSGIPRYDRLISLASNVPKKMGKITRALFCGSFLEPFSPDVRSFLGCSIYDFQYFQELAIRTLLRVAENFPLIVTVKPHYREDEILWKRMVADTKPRCRTRVAKASEDFRTLLTQADVLVVCGWSSTLIEAGIAQIPVLYFDPDHQDSGQVKRLEESGLCQFVRNEADFQAALKRLCDEKPMKTEPRRLSAAQAYYLGDLQGQASSRVAEFILNKIRGEAYVAA